MMDQLYMRAWNDGHDNFSADLDRGLAKAAGAISRLRRRRNERDTSLRSRIGLS